MSVLNTDPDTPTMTQPLPDEIIAKICTTIASSRDASIQNHSDTATQTLHALTLTNRQFHRTATPLLCETVIFNRPDTHQKLFRTLRTNPPLASCVRNIVFFEPGEKPPPQDTMGDILSPEHLAQEERMAKDAKQLWDAVHNLDQQNGVVASRWTAKDQKPTASDFDEHAPETRDAVVDFILLLMRLPSVTRFRYIGLEKESMFRLILQDVGAALRTNLAGDLASRILPSIQEMHISGLASEILAPFTLTVFAAGIRDLRTLDMGFLCDIHGDGNAVQIPRFSMSSYALRTIRDLRLSSLILTPYDLSLLIPRMECLEILHYEWHPTLDKTSLENNAFRHIITAVSTQKENITDLRITINPQAWTAASPSIQPTDSIPPWTFASYPRLKTLHVPDMVLFDISCVLRIKLPTDIVCLGITAWFIKDDLPGMLGDLALGAGPAPTLRRVVVMERVTEMPLLWGLLREVQERFESRAVSFEHFWV